VKIGVFPSFDFLQGCSSQEEAVTSQEMTSRDVRSPEVTRKWRNLTGSQLEVAAEGRKLTYTVRLTSYKAVARRRQSLDRKRRHVASGDRKWLGSYVIWPEVTKRLWKPGNCRILCVWLPTRLLLSGGAVTWQEMTSRDLRWPEVTQKWRHLTGSHLEVAVEGRKLASFDRKSPGSGCRRPKTGVYCVFDFILFCSTQEEAVTWQEMTSCDSGELNWSGSDVIRSEVTWKWL